MYNVEPQYYEQIWNNGYGYSWSTRIARGMHAIPNDNGLGENHGIDFESLKRFAYWTIDDVELERFKNANKETMSAMISRSKKR